MGRPRSPINLTAEQIEELAAIGCADDEICVLAGVSESTLKRHFDPQLLKGRASLRQSIRRKQLARALNDGDIAMLIWLGKVYLKQTEKQIQVNVDVSQLSDAELDAILKA